MDWSKINKGYLFRRSDSKTPIDKERLRETMETTLTDFLNMNKFEDCIRVFQESPPTANAIVNDQIKLLQDIVKIYKKLDDKIHDKFSSKMIDTDNNCLLLSSSPQPEKTQLPQLEAFIVDEVKNINGTQDTTFTLSLSKQANLNRRSDVKIQLFQNFGLHLQYLDQMWIFLSTLLCERKLEVPMKNLEDSQKRDYLVCKQDSSVKGSAEYNTYQSFQRFIRSLRKINPKASKKTQDKLEGLFSYDITLLSLKDDSLQELENIIRKKHSTTEFQSESIKSSLWESIKRKIDPIYQKQYLDEMKKHVGEMKKYTTSLTGLCFGCRF